MAEKVLIDAGTPMKALEHGDEELLLKLARMEVLMLYMVLYEYLWSYLYLNRDYLKEKELVEKLFRVVYPDQAVLLKAMEMDVQLAKRSLRVPPPGRPTGSAAALVLDTPLLTKDNRHYERLEDYGLKLINSL